MAQDHTTRTPAAAAAGVEVIDPGRHNLTIEELAAETGISVRNLRSHRARGLLQPPQVRNRVGYYGTEHVARVRLTRQLQDEGFNLAAIRRLVDLAGGQSDLQLSLVEAAAAPFESEEPQIFTVAELRERFGDAWRDDALEAAVKLGILMPEGEDNYAAPSPALLDAAEQVVSFGVPLHHALAVIEKVQARCDDIAHEFIRLFLDDVWRPFTADGFPADGWAEVSKAIETLRPLSSQVVLSTYQHTMTREVERATAKEFERLAKRRRG